MKLKPENNSAFLRAFEIALFLVFIMGWHYVVVELLYFSFILIRLPEFVGNLLAGSLTLGSMGLFYFLLRRVVYGSFRGRPTKKVKKKNIKGAKIKKMKLENNSAFLRAFKLAVFIAFVIIVYGYINAVLYAIVSVGFFAFDARLLSCAGSLGILVAIYFLLHRLIYGCFHGRPPTKVGANSVKEVEKKK